MMSQKERDLARRRQSAAIVAAEPDEGDWKGMLYGIALAVGGVFFVIGCIHIYLRLTS